MPGLNNFLETRWRTYFDNRDFPDCLLAARSRPLLDTAFDDEEPTWTACPRPERPIALAKAMPSLAEISYECEEPAS